MGIMEIKQKKTLSLSPAVCVLLEKYLEHGYHSMSDMAEAAIRRLSSEATDTKQIDEKRIAALVDEKVAGRFAVEKQFLASDIADEVLRRVLNQLSRQDHKAMHPDTSDEELDQVYGEAFDATPPKESWRVS